jgi:hypothetical protein
VNFLVAIACWALMCAASLVATRVIRRKTGRGSRLTSKGYVIFICGFFLSEVCYAYFFQWSRFQAPIIFGGLGGLWALIGQFFAGEKAQV